MRDVNELKRFINKDADELEKALGFTHYLELKDWLISGKDQSHSSMVDAFFNFVSSDLVVVETDDGSIRGFFPMSNEEIRKNLLLLEKQEGAFEDPNEIIIYAFLGDNFFAYVMNKMIMLSASKENCERMAKILDNHNLEYFEPYELEEHESTFILRKLGRNEPCHCGSGNKYKKCCLDKDVKETGKVKKVRGVYY